MALGVPVAVAVNMAVPVAVVQMAVADAAAVAEMAVVPVVVAPVHLGDEPAFAGSGLRAERRQR